MICFFVEVLFLRSENIIFLTKHTFFALNLRIVLLSYFISLHLADFKMPVVRNYTTL